MTITVQVPDVLLEDLATSPEELNREIRLAAAIHLYSRGLVSQGKGAEIANLSRWDFIQALGRAEVPACQVTSEELKEEVERAYERIVNASPLILLTKIGRIDLLYAEDVDVVVPNPVLLEVSNLDPADPTVVAIHDAGWSVVMPSSPVPESLSRWKLDPGEESVLTVALQSPGCEVVIDDLAGRRCAAAHGITLLGTVGLVILAKRIGRITKARPIIEDLRRVGLYVKDTVIADALKEAGE